MLMEKERELIVEYGKKMFLSGLTKGTSGNISIYDPNNKLMAISPSGIEYLETEPSDIVIMDLEGNIVDGLKKPSSEYNLHIAFYKTRNDVKAIVHTHSIYCTTFACLRQPLRAIHYVIGVTGSDTVPCAEYATYGTPELANNAVKACGNGRAVLLANHGLVTIGENLQKAFSLANNIEYIAEIQYRTECIGEPAVLNRAEMKIVMEKFKTHGQTNKINMY